MLFSMSWRDLAQKPMEAALRRLYPYKARPLIVTAARGCLVDFEWAWAAYDKPTGPKRGMEPSRAAAAILDLITFLSAHELPMPAELAADLAYLARAALVNDGMARRGPDKNELGAHRAALVRRLRHGHVAAVLQEARRQKHEDTWLDRRLPPVSVARIRKERPPASSVVKEAVRIAREKMPPIAGAKHVQDEALYRDFREVEDAYQAGVDPPYGEPPGDPAWRKAGIWPGPYYLPSAKTCEAVGWSDLADAFLQLGVPSDAPAAIVA